MKAIALMGTLLLACNAGTGQTNRANTPSALRITPLEERSITTDGYPHSIAVDGDDIYITILGKNKNLTAEDEDGYVYKISPGDATPQKTSKEGSASAPKGITVDKDNIYITDIDHLMVIDKKEGRMAGHVNIGADGPLTGLADIVSLGDGRYIVSCTDNDKIYICDPRTKSFGEIVTRTPLRKPAGLAWDNAGKTLYVVENNSEQDGKKTIPTGRILAIDIATGTVEQLSTALNKMLGQYTAAVYFDGELYYSDISKSKTPEAIQKYNFKLKKISKVARGPIDEITDFAIRGNQYIAVGMNEQKIHVATMAPAK